MKISCVGGGPAGLYFSILMKGADPSHDITVYERNPAGSTYGWGVTYWAELLDALYDSDPESACAIRDASVRWETWRMHLQDRAVVTVEGWDDGFGIGRHELLRILTERAYSLGVRIEFEHEITDETELAGSDLVVAGDGVNSVLRERHAGHFRPHFAAGRNVYTWLGTTKVFESFLFAFVPTEHGWIWCYGYPFSTTHSTCVVECPPETWRGLGLHEMNDADCLGLLEKLFADVLDGHPLMSGGQGGARWVHFRTLTNRAWYRDNMVLAGDAAHTTHYSIGAGTALALADAACLAGALMGDPRVPVALRRYARTRRSAVRASQKAARYSARWYENLPRYIDLPPRQLVTLLGQRHSSLLAHLPPRLYCRVGRLIGTLTSLGRRG
ncbi:FAD-binding monooxygenase [Nonomuraea terrae]|uniref:FAD-binding monooxygenase n=1 Tax=Nonomuraea terrae TaxID=2530383 RepID=A0A4R4Y8I6_9ACTN|nr:FAD-dependent monooxygenase [Nonomuraea terrae]TDD40808.1 FAD-binding monooxygenase [Nonomuraea terrae]